MTLYDMRQTAIAEAEPFAEPGCKPIIDVEFYDIVDRHQRAQIHTISTAYSYGDVVQLLARNGHRYRCTTAGTSDATAPTFPTSMGASLTDGTVTWVEDGTDYANVYDVRAIIHDSWMVKASKSSHLVTASSGNAKIEASALQAQCRQRAMDYAPIGIA